jgi:VanZ family protein
MALVGRFGPPLALMGLIFFLSAQPDLGTGLGVWDTVLRKLAHMTVYGALWFLWWRALGYGHPAPSVAITLAYAIADELHQTTVAGRHGSPWDVALDALGVGLAGLAVVLYDRRVRGTPRASRVPWR